MDESKLPINIEDWLATQPEDDPYAILLDSEMKAIVSEIVNNLTPREKHVILARYINSNDTLQMIGDEMNLSKSSINNIENNAFKSIRKALFKKGFNRDDVKSVFIKS